MERATWVLSDTRASGWPSASAECHPMSAPVQRSPNSQSTIERGLVPRSTTTYRALSRSLTTNMTFWSNRVIGAR